MLIVSGHLMFNIWRRHLLIKVCNFFDSVFVSLQVSDPYRRTDLTLLLNILNLCLLDSVDDFQIGRRVTKACLALFILACISSSVPPVFVMMLPR